MKASSSVNYLKPFKPSSDWQLERQTRKNITLVLKLKKNLSFWISWSFFTVICNHLSISAVQSLLSFDCLRKCIWFDKCVDIDPNQKSKWPMFGVVLLYLRKGIKLIDDYLLGCWIVNSWWFTGIWEFHVKWNDIDIV